MMYSPELEHSMRMFHDSLSEKDRRRYAAIEAAKLGHGGTGYIRVLQDRTAGDPMRQEVRWTDLTYEQIAGHLAEAGTPVSVPVVKQLLRKHGYVTRKAQKSKAMGSHPDRNRQFETIARLKREYMASD